MRMLKLRMERMRGSATTTTTTTTTLPPTTTATSTTDPWFDLWFELDNATTQDYNFEYRIDLRRIAVDWPSGSPATIQYTALDSHLARYQNPREADAMTKVQAELDETKIILHNTMESLLERGEKLDDLVQKSEHLGNQSKAFYKTARKQNSCCEIM
ncbi:synaptobrevin homolog YKT6 [Sinocyclocheilus grahami]|uniref:synaptobrevin homolog YKT6 n=1 Tax=Sinocyclocheilus grahami TaxID=75366 RepID=UPI0007AC9C02|nr:PREDICTED: synaptobrevin homolog YKT6 [Sinocyclocheilus grahami]